MRQVDLWKSRIALVNLDGSDHNCPRRAEMQRARVFRSIRRAEEREKEMDLTPIQKIFQDLMRRMAPTTVVVEEEHDGFGTAEEGRP